MSEEKKQAIIDAAKQLVADYDAQRPYLTRNVNALRAALKAAE